MYLFKNYEKNYWQPSATIQLSSNSMQYYCVLFTGRYTKFTNYAAKITQWTQQQT